MSPCGCRRRRSKDSAPQRKHWWISTARQRALCQPVGVAARTERPNARTRRRSGRRDRLGPVLVGAGLDQHRGRCATEFNECSNRRAWCIEDCARPGNRLFISHTQCTKGNRRARSPPRGCPHGRSGRNGDRRVEPRVTPPAGAMGPAGVSTGAAATGAARHATPDRACRRDEQQDRPAEATRRAEGPECPLRGRIRGTEAQDPRLLTGARWGRPRSSGGSSRGCYGRWRVGRTRRGGSTLDRLAGADLEVRQDQFVLHGFVILLGPAAQPVQADVPGHVGGRQRAVSRGVPGLPGTGVVRKQRPAVVGRGHRLRQRGQRLAAVPRRRQGCDTVPRRPTLRTADKTVTIAGRPDAVGV